jgi:hypothetical protein
MRLLKNRTTKWLLAIASVFLIAGGAFYIYSSKILADVNASDTSFLNGLQDKPNLNDPTLLRLPSNFSQADIKSALTNQAAGASTKGLSTKDIQVTSYIKAQEDKIARSLPLQVGTKEKPAMNDLVFRVADSSGTIITPSQVTATKIRTVADNFSFDPTVTQKEKDLLIQAYPIIQSVYGPRQNTEKIKVFHDVTLERGDYDSPDNTINLDRDNRTDEPIHELVHAFHGYKCLNSLWEEGFAVFMTTYVEKQMNLPTDEYYLTQLGYSLNFENLPSTYDTDLLYNAWQPWLTNLPYMYGSMILEKISLEDMGFFKKFNQQLYAASNPSESAVVKMAINSVATIEGQDSWLWFSHQYPYIDFYQDQSPAPETYFSDLGGTVSHGYDCGGIGVGSAPKGGVGGSTCSFVFTMRASYEIGSGDFNVRFLDDKGNVLVDTPNIDTNDKWGNNVTKIYNNPSDLYKNYQGLVLVEVTPTSNPSNQQTFSFLKTDEQIGAKNIYVYSKTGNIAVFSGQSNGTTKSNGMNKIAVAKANGYFSVNAVSVQGAGKYKVEIYNKKAGCTSANLLDCLGTKTDEQFFNKGDLGKYYSDFINIGLSNNCSPASPQIKSLNRSLSFSLTTGINCGQVVGLNRVPLYRSWGSATSIILQNLARNRNYRYQVSYSSDLSKTIMQLGTAATSSYTDFKLLSSKSYGSPSNNSFYQRLTFSNAYDPGSVKLALSNELGDVTFTVRKVDDKTFDLVPVNTYNNSNYYVENLNLVTDTHGNPLCNFAWDMQTFSTPINPLNSPALKLSVGSSTYHAADSIIINKNFASVDLLSKLSDIKLFKELDGSDCQQGFTGVCGLVDTSISIVNNQIVVKPKQPLLFGKNYYFSIPVVVDDANNLISSEKENQLSFSVN